MGMGPQPSTCFSHGQGSEDCSYAQVWHLVNERSMTVLRSPTPPDPSRGHIPHEGSGHCPILNTSWLELAVGWAPPGQPGRGRGVLESRGWASHPGWARTPRPWPRPKPALFTESVSSVPPPPPGTSPGVLGAGIGAGGA